jgi:hypothetical protein
MTNRIPLAAFVVLLVAASARADETTIINAKPGQEIVIQIKRDETEQAADLVQDILNENFAAALSHGATLHNQLMYNGSVYPGPQNGTVLDTAPLTDMENRDVMKRTH